MKVRRHDRDLGPRVRVRPWAYDAGVVHLALADQAIVPHEDELAGWIDTLRTGPAARRSAADGGRALHTIRTGALFPDAAATFLDAGFVVIDTLTLLRVELAGVEFDRPPPSTAPLRPHHLSAAALVDRRAFGDPWGNDADDLTEIRHATPVHRARSRGIGSAWRGRRQLVAFAITGAASGQGYLQRLAVDPDHQRAGHGRALVMDSLAWMRRRGATHGVVNTAVTNTPALALYESIGFRRLPERLVVLQLDVAGFG